MTVSNANSYFKVPFANTTGTTSGNFELLHESGSTFTYLPSDNLLTVGRLSVGALGEFGSNGTGQRTIQSGGTASGGNNGDIYYIY